MQYNTITPDGKYTYTIEYNVETGEADIILIEENYLSIS